MLESRTMLTVLFDNAVSQSLTAGAHHAIAHAQIELVFWGADWNSTNEAPVRSAISAILASHYQDALSQYTDVEGKATTTVGPATLDQTFTLNNVTLGKGFDSLGVEKLLVDAFKNVSGFPVPASDQSNNLYIVIPEKGAVPSGGESNFGGRHGYAAFGAKTGTVHYKYAWIGNQLGTYDSAGTLNQAGLDELTATFSHELVEAITDPDLKSYTFGGDAAQEIADGPAQGFGYRLTTGDSSVFVQPYYSPTLNYYVVPDGNTQKFQLDHNHKLIIKGDQLANVNDTITIDEDSDAQHDISVTLNNERVVFDATYFPWQSATARQPVVSSIEIDTQKGSNTINIVKTAKVTIGSAQHPMPVTIKGANSTDTVMLASTSHNLDDIQSTVTVASGAATTSITLSDQNALSAETFKVLSGDVQRGTIGLLKFPTDKTVSLDVEGSTAHPATFSVSNVSAKTSLTLSGHSGKDQFNLSPVDQTLNHILGSVAVVESMAGSGSTLSVYDGKNGTAMTWTITDHSIKTTASANLITYTGIDVLDIFGTGAASTYNVSSTNASTTTTIHAGAGKSVFNLTADSKLITMLAGKLILDGKKDSSLTVNDQLSMFATYYLTSTEVLLGDPTVSPIHVTYTNMKSLVMNGSLKVGLWHIHGTPSGTTVTVNTSPSGMDHIDLDAADVASSFFTIKIRNSATPPGAPKGPPVGFVFLSDGDSPTTYTLTDSSLKSSAAPKFNLMFNGPLLGLGIENVKLCTLVNSSSHPATLDDKSVVPGETYTFVPKPT